MHPKGRRFLTHFPSSFLHWKRIDCHILSVILFELYSKAYGCYFCIVMSRMFEIMWHEWNVIFKKNCLTSICQNVILMDHGNFMQILCKFYANFSKIKKAFFFCWMNGSGGFRNKLVDRILSTMLLNYSFSWIKDLTMRLTVIVSEHFMVVATLQKHDTL